LWFVALGVLQQCSLRWCRRLLAFEHPLELAYRDAEAASYPNDRDLATSCGLITRVFGKAEIPPSSLWDTDRLGRLIVHPENHPV
jgi:hypothetical protein